MMEGNYETYLKLVISSEFFVSRCVTTVTIYFRVLFIKLGDDMLLQYYTETTAISVSYRMTSA